MDMLHTWWYATQLWLMMDDDGLTPLWLFIGDHSQQWRPASPPINPNNPNSSPGISQHRCCLHIRKSREEFRHRVIQPNLPLLHLHHERHSDLRVEPSGRLFTAGICTAGALRIFHSLSKSNHGEAVNDKWCKQTFSPLLIWTNMQLIKLKDTLSTITLFMTIQWAIYGERKSTWAFADQHDFRKPKTKECISWWICLGLRAMISNQAQIQKLWMGDPALNRPPVLPWMLIYIVYLSSHMVGLLLWTYLCESRLRLSISFSFFHILPVCFHSQARPSSNFSGSI